MKQHHAISRSGLTTVSVALVLGLIGVGLGTGAITMRNSLEARGVRLQKLPIHPADKRTLASMPLETPNWRRVGSDRIERAEIEEVLGTSNYISRTFIQKNPPSGQEPKFIEFHAAYYTGMIDTVPHVPERCFVGGGLQQSSRTETLRLPMDTSRWSRDPDVPESMAPIYRTRTNDRSSLVRLPRNPQGLQLRISEFTVPGERTLRAGYFFVANGDWVANANGVRLLSFRLNEEYAYYMKVQFTSASFDSNEEFAAASASLLDELFGDLMLCTPDWVDVKTGNHPEVSSRTAIGAGSTASPGQS